MRLGIHAVGQNKWPWVNLEVWERYPILIVTGGHQSTTFLKAFHGAPVWTIEELQIFEQCFAARGFQRIGAYPSAASLSIPIVGQ
jgi:hypothetical protein